MAQGLTKNGKKALDAVNGQYISKTGKLTDAPGGLTLNGKAWNMAGTLSWTARTTPATWTYRKIISNGTICVVTASTASSPYNNIAISSTDGTKWTSRGGAGLGNSYYFYNLNLCNGAFIISGSINGTTKLAFSSTDGTSWSAIANPGTSGTGTYGCSWDGTRYTWLTNDANFGISYSTTLGGTKTPATGTLTSAGQDIIRALGRTIIVTSGSTILTSTSTVYAAASGNTGAKYSLATGNNVVVAVGSGISYSTNGTTWTNCTNVGNGTWRAVTYGNGTFVALGAFGADGYSQATSKDGINWTLTTLHPSVTVYGVTWHEPSKMFISTIRGASTSAAVHTTQASEV